MDIDYCAASFNPLPFQYEPFVHPAESGAEEKNPVSPNRMAITKLLMAIICCVLVRISTTPKIGWQILQGRMPPKSDIGNIFSMP